MGLFTIIGLVVVAIMIYALIVNMITFFNNDLAESSFMVGGFEAVIIALLLFEKLE